MTSVDPAGSYDFGSWNIQYNIFQQLMTVPANGSEPEPDLADCAYDDPTTITCTLTEGATFSNGDELTSSDVLFSFQRNIEIAGPQRLLGAARLDQQRETPRTPRSWPTAPSRRPTT